MGYSYESENIEDWESCGMDNEGHLVSIKSRKFQLSNETIEHLSNFPRLLHLSMDIRYEEEKCVTNFSLLANLRKLTLIIRKEFEYQELFKDPELLKDLGLFSNLIALSIEDITGNPPRCMITLY